MSNFHFDQDRDNAGKQAAKRLKNRIGGDTSSFRTVIEKNLATGEETMLRTKGGMPEVTKKPGKKITLDTGERTFVFRVSGENTAVVANKDGSGLTRVGSPFLTGMASYFVAPWKKSAKSKWNDVIRLDNPDGLGNSDVILNHTTFTEQDKTISKYSPSGVPYAHRVSGSYASINPNAAAQSLLYIGSMSNIGRGVSNILKTGASGLTVPISNEGSSHIGYSANVRVKPDGTYLFYGGTVSYIDTDNQLVAAITTWSSIKTLLEAPYIVKDVYGERAVTLLNKTAVELLFPVGYSGVDDGQTYPGDLPDAIPISFPPAIPGTYVRKSTGHSIRNYGQHSSTDIPDYAYVGTDVQMGFTSSIDVQNFSDATAMVDGTSVGPYATYDFTNPKPPFEPLSISGMQGFGYQIIEYDAAVGFALTTAFDTKKKLTEVRWARRWTKRHWPQEVYVAGTVADGDWIRTACGMPLNTSPRFDRIQLDVTTVDYLYADIDESVFITLESSIYRFIENDVYVGGHPSASTDEYGYTARYIVSVRGIETEFPITFTLPSDFGRPWARAVQISAAGIPLSGGGAFYPEVGYCPLGYRPTPIFNPAYMGQGNCPFIAYTTKAEEAAGVAPEFYLDMTVFLNRHQANAGSADGYRYTSTVTFTPMQFIRAYYQFIQIEFGNTINQNETAWYEHMFPVGRDVYRLQLCNGVKGSWASPLGTGFANDPQMEITRI